MTGIGYYLSLGLHCKLDDSSIRRACVPWFRGSQFNLNFASCSMLTCTVASMQVVRLKSYRDGTTFTRGLPWWRAVGDPPMLITGVCHRARHKVAQSYFVPCSDTTYVHCTPRLISAYRLSRKWLMLCVDPLMLYRAFRNTPRSIKPYSRTGLLSVNHLFR